MFVEIVLGMAEVDSWKELTESFLKPCGTPAGSKGSHLPGGRTVTWSEEAFKRFLGAGKGLSPVNLLASYVRRLNHMFIEAETDFCNLDHHSTGNDLK